MTLEEARNRVKELDSGSGFYSSDYEAGWEDALRRATEILDKVEPVGNPDTLTLKELAHELRKIFNFRWLTITDDYPTPTLMLWTDKPGYDGHGWNIFNVTLKPYRGSATTYALNTDLDLSEYKDADGNIDYSKCIVEVA